MEEIWKPITGYENYSVSNLGRIKRNYHKRIDRPAGEILKNQINVRNKYAYIKLFGHQGSKFIRIHKLVAIEFLGPPPTPKHVINHKDGIKSNNIVENLEWVTRGENNRHARETGLWKSKGKPLAARGEKHGMSKLTDEQAKEIFEAPRTKGMRILLSQKYGVGTGVISAIRYRRTWKHISS